MYVDLVTKYNFVVVYYKVVDQNQLQKKSQIKIKSIKEYIK